MDWLTFTVHGLPQPKGSAMAFRHNRSGRVIVRADNARTLKPWEASVRAAALEARGRADVWHDGAVALFVVFQFTRPGHASARAATRPYPTVKPDLSKLVRGIEDALTGVIYRDDAQITQINTWKQYHDDGSTPRADVMVVRVGAP